MTLLRKIITTLVTGGIALTGTTVADAQSSSLFTNLSSSSQVPAPTPKESNYKAEREMYLQVVINDYQLGGYTVTEENNRLAEEAANLFDAGASLGEMSQFGTKNKGFVNIIATPNQLVASETERILRLSQHYYPYGGDNLGFAVTGNDINTYLVSFDYHGQVFEQAAF